MMTDPIADLLTRIRNAVRIERPTVDVPASRLKAGVADVLKREGFIYDYQVGLEKTDAEGHPVFEPVRSFDAPKTVLRVFLKYGPEGEKVLRHIRRVSRPGRRLYRGYKDLAPVLEGLGIAVLSTSKGVMSDREARREKLGGEWLCTVW
jgi:small subunit ribosomal protein S8